MTAIAFFAAATLLGINVGWQPTPDGGVEYIIQIPPGRSSRFAPARRFKATSRPRCSAKCGPIGSSSATRRCRGSCPCIRPWNRRHWRRRKSPAERAAEAAAAPAPLPPNPASKPMIGQPAVFVEPAPARKELARGSKTRRGDSSPSAAKPWLPLWLTAVALFASLGANVYLGWIAIDVRRRWRTLVEKAA